MDREQGARKFLADRGYRLHSIFTLNEVLDHYLAGGQIEPNKYHEIVTFLAG